MAKKLPCTAVEKRKPLGTFWLECCGLARGAPRRPVGAAERFFFRDFALGNRLVATALVASVVASAVGQVTRLAEQVVGGVAADAGRQQPARWYSVA